MPRIVRRVGEESPLNQDGLAAELAAELKANRGLAQPIIDEQHYPKTSAVRVVVVWDKLNSVPEDERATVILDAYQIAEGHEFSERIALATGMTVPEAAAVGLLPYVVDAAIRPTDPVTVEQCKEAMKAQGASTLVDPSRPQLRFSRLEDAEECRRRLTTALPGSEPVWMVRTELSPSEWVGSEAG